MGQHHPNEGAAPVGNEAEDLVDHQFVDALAAYDEALAAGQPLPPPTSLTALPAVAQQRLEEARAVLQLLDHIHPRPSAAAAPGKDSLAPDQGRAPASKAQLTSPSASPTTHSPGRSLARPVSTAGPIAGRYLLERILGHGGMGVVYLAFDLSLQRQVAVKMISTLTSPSAEDVRRFWAEAEAAGRLQHPNLVAVHDVGLHASAGGAATAVPGHGVHRGQQPLRRADRPALPGTAGGPAAGNAGPGPPARSSAPDHSSRPEAGQHPAAAESHGSLCGFEPASSGAGVAGGWQLGDFEPKVSDFGLAKLLDGDAGLTCSGMVVGTPMYMAPEQARGHSQAIGPATDVYALGVILYELLTGRPPFQGVRRWTSTLRMPLRRAGAAAAAATGSWPATWRPSA